ncbi:MAG: hypothetical protein ACXABY_09635 [Candidatus Thorarchaeota archaeon]|jgi:hypothetical protein
MIKRYKTISGIRGILEGSRVEDVEFEYQDSMLDLAKANAVYPDTYYSIISNSTELNRRRDDEWREENPNPEPYMHEPSLMSVMMPSSLPCVTIQIGIQTFHFDEDVETMFSLVCNERNDYETIRRE